MHAKRWFQSPFWAFQIVISAFVCFPPAIRFQTDTICVTNCLHPSSNRKPILANTSQGFECHSEFSAAWSDKNPVLFFSCTWLTMAPARHFVLSRHMLHPLQRSFFYPPMSLIITSLKNTHAPEPVCARLVLQCVPLACTVILLTVFFVFVFFFWRQCAPRSDRHFWPEDIGLIALTLGNRPSAFY